MAPLVDRKKESKNNFLVNIGILIDPLENSQIKEWAFIVKDSLQKELSGLFPQFTWELSILERHDFPKALPKDPLTLLEFGSDIKIENNYDFLLVLTSLPLKARFSQGINAVPSSMLETAIISLSKIFECDKEGIKKISAINLIKHVLGHLWGLDHNESSVMKPRKSWCNEQTLDWNSEEKNQIEDFLNDVADPRVEETNSTKSTFLFYLRVLIKEGPSLLRDIIFFRSWRMFLNLGRFTAATAVSIIFLFLSAEAWEMGAAIQSRWLDYILLLVIIASTLSLYFGQNLHGIGQSDKMKEQAVRSRIILIGTLFVGMVSFWLNLLCISFIIINFLPEKVISGWAGLGNSDLPVFHFSKLMATFGILASSVGGNLEEEQDIKAVLIYTEET